MNFNRLMEWLIFPLFIVTAIVGLVYWYWTTTPTYALTQIVSSIKNRDTETFEKYVDIESIVYKAIDDLLHGPARDAGMFGHLDNIVGVGIISLFKPELAEIARTQVLKFIEQGSLAKELPEAKKLADKNQTPESPGATPPVTETEHKVEEEEKPKFKPPQGLSGIFKPPSSSETSFGRLSKNAKVANQLKAYGLSKEGFQGVDYLKTEGPTALVGLKFHSPELDRDYIIELKMEESAGSWRITALSNLNELVNLYLETKDEIKAATEEKSLLIPVDFRILQQPA